MQRREWVGAGGISPANLYVTIEDYSARLWKHEARELFRGFAGALFVALPLLYTMEMWERAREIPSGVLLIFLAVTFVANLGYISYSGYKVARSRTYLLWDVTIAMGLGALASLITLCITMRITTDTPLPVTTNLIALMTVPTSFGAALAINQIGKRQGGRSADESIAETYFSEDMKKITATALGALLFSFNLLPTLEPKQMLLDIGPAFALLILIFSLMVSHGISWTARFHSKDADGDSGVLSEPWLLTLFSYLVTLVVSALMLWVFGYIGLSTPPQMWVPWVIIVGYAGTLGGAAGRLVL